MIKYAVWCCCCGAFLGLAVPRLGAEQSAPPTAGAQQDSPSEITTPWISMEEDETAPAKTQAPQAPAPQQALPQQTTPQQATPQQATPQQATPQQAVPQQAAPQHAVPQHAVPRTHTVWIWQETGDCLWTLAKKYYGDPWLWKKIYLANQNQIADPAVIYPKQVLVIPPLDETEK